MSICHVIYGENDCGGTTIHKGEIEAEGCQEYPINLGINIHYYDFGQSKLCVDELCTICEEASNIIGRCVNSGTFSYKNILGHCEEFGNSSKISKPNERSCRIFLEKLLGFL